MKDKETPALRQALLLKQDVISGFSYSYCRALLDKFKELHATGRIFIDNEQAKENEEIKCISLLTPIADLVSSHLEDQISGFRVGNAFYYSRIAEQIQIAEEFLAIFEQKRKGKRLC